MNEGSERIGCIDGQVLDVRRSAHEVCLIVADTQVRLSTGAAGLLAGLLTADLSSDRQRGARCRVRTLVDSIRAIREDRSSDQVTRRSAVCGISPEAPGNRR